MKLSFFAANAGRACACLPEPCIHALVACAHGVGCMVACTLLKGAGVVQKKGQPVGSCRLRCFGNPCVFAGHKELLSCHRWHTVVAQMRQLLSKATRAQCYSAHTKCRAQQHKLMLAMLVLDAWVRRAAAPVRCLLLGCLTAVHM